MPRVFLLAATFGSVFAFLVACGAGADGGGFVNGPGAQTRTPAAGALDLLRSDRFGRLVLEIDAVSGFGPAAGNADALATRLASLVDKPAGIEVRMDQVLAPSGGDRVWTFPTLSAFAASVFDRPAEEDTVHLHVLFVDGRYAAPEGSTVLGLAWGHRHIVIFKETLEQTCGGGALTVPMREQVCADAERFVWLHELGHVLGLVDNGVVMQSPHEDDEHPAHDRDPDCVMYWAYEGDAVVQRVIGDVTGQEAGLDFCDACLDDLRVARGSPSAQTAVED